MNINNKFRNSIRLYAMGVILPSLMFWSCTEEDIPGINNTDTTTYSLTLKTDGVNTRATIPGEEAYNENKIENYTIIFYDKDNWDTPLYMIQEDNLTASGTYTVNLKLTEADIEKIFGTDGTSCRAYAVVNLIRHGENENDDPDYDSSQNIIYNDFSIGTDGIPQVGGSPASKAHIEAATIQRDFGQFNQAPSSFVMTGEANNITLDRANRSMSGTINLKRIAAKFRIWLKFPELVFVEQSGNVLSEAELKEKGYKDEAGNIVEEKKSEFLEAGGSVCVPIKPDDPRFTGQDGESSYPVTLSLIKGAKRARLDGKVILDESKGISSRWLQETDYFSSRSPKVINKTNQNPFSDPGFQYSNTLPVYSFPNTWENSVSETQQSSLRLTLYWEIETKKDDESTATKNRIPSYYELPINRLGNPNNCMQPNTYYRVGLTVGMLGSFSAGEPEIIDQAYWEAVAWQEEDIDMSLKENTFLVFNQSEYTLNNTQKIEIPFSSSHDVKIEAVYLTYFRFNDKWGYMNHAKTSDNQSSNANNTEFYSRSNNNNGKGLTTEGLITNNNYGDVYAWPGYYTGSYYIGREHPKTITPDQVKATAESMDNKDLYLSKFGMTTMYECTVDNQTKRLTFNHPLIRWEEKNVNNNGVPSYYSPVLNNAGTGFKDAYSRYDITIILTMEDEERAKEIQPQYIHIIQYPAMYVEVSNNPASLTINNPTNTVNPNVFVNNDGNSTNGAYGGRNPMGADYSLTGNYNPNMYVIHTTQISEDNDKQYTLGDPRVLVSNVALGSTGTTANRWGRNNNNNTNTANNAAMRAANRMYESNNSATQYLLYYYPTDETVATQAGSKENFIAPTFRIASSFGKTYDVSKINAAKRCASYQEAGRPAGRWRIPTKAEIAYMRQLSDEGIIPELFTSGKTYWSSTGAIQINNNGDIVTSTSTSNPVRCVYDEWYWITPNGSQDLAPGGETTTTFYWGDKPKDNTQTRQ